MGKKTRLRFPGGEIARVALVLGFSAALGLVVNAFSSHRLVIFQDTPASGGENPAGKASAIPRVTMGELARAWKDTAESVLVMDVRGLAEFELGHIPHSLNVPLDSIAKSHQELAPTLQSATLIVVLCDSEDCSKSDEAAEMLIKLGYKKVRVLQGGWEAYYHSGFEIEEGNR